MTRLCVCGVPINDSCSLCHTCYEIYGGRRALWPDWLVEWMRSYDRELSYDKKGNTDLSLDGLSDKEII